MGVLTAAAMSAACGLPLGTVLLSVSIVIPVHDELENVGPLGEEIRQAMSAAGLEWECIWVDDASDDGTAPALRSLTERDSRFRLVELDGHQGQSAALAAGFARASKSLVATLDGDGQNDPADLPRMIRLLADGKLDVVNGYRPRRYRWVRWLASRIGNGFRNRLTGDSVRDIGCSTRVMREYLVRGLPVFRGMHRFLPSLVRLNGGTRQIEVPVQHRPRRSGMTKYGISDRLWCGIADTFAVRWWSKRAIRPVVRKPRLEPVSPAGRSGNHAPNGRGAEGSLAREQRKEGHR
jgi:glycosyltransferase involved in cell wall biosynthesis